MTDLELYNLIAGDATAATLANAGNDSGCAARCMEIAQPERVPTILTERGFCDNVADPLVSDSILRKLENYSKTNGQYASLVSRFLNWLTPANEGSDWGSPKTLGLAALLAQSGVITWEEYTVISSVSLKVPTITGSDVSRVWRGAV
jgi:hypothetical protein